MALPDQLADLERKVSVRFSAALAEIRQEMRRAVEAQAQRASSAMLSDLDAIRPPAAASLLADDDLLEMTREAQGEARRDLARALRRALVDFDRARSQNAVLEALLTAAGPFGDHAALWLLRPTELLGWASRGFAGDPIAGCSLSHQASPALARFATGRGCVVLDATEAAQLASALEITAPARALLVPLVLRDRVAAALYLDAAAAGEFEIETLQILTLAAAQRLELQALATRSYTPTLFLDDEAPANEGGLALWDPAVPASGGEAPETDSAAPAEVDAWEESPAAVAADVAPATADREEPTLAAAMPEMPAPGPWMGVESEPEVVARPTESGAAEIAWQMEEADETALFDAAPAAAAEAAAEIPDRSAGAEKDWLEATPTYEIPLSPPAPATTSALAPAAAGDWQEVEELTAPHATLESAATQRFVTPAATNEFPQPAVAPAPEFGALPASSASTIAFVPPAGTFEADLAEDATVRIQRSALQPPPPPPQPPLPPQTISPPPTFAAAAEPARPAPAAPSLHDEEPTISRGPRTTEVAPPADLQGPGWAFSSARAPRASGDNALHEEARRLARLLVSEIKLYNEDQVEEGRHNRDIYHRLKDDIDRSRQIYEERVHESVRGTTDYFQQELIRSLAGGDPRALGI